MPTITQLMKPPIIKTGMALEKFRFSQSNKVVLLEPTKSEMPTVKTTQTIDKIINKIICEKIDFFFKQITSYYDKV